MLSLRKNCTTNEELDAKLQEAIEEFAGTEMAHINLLIVDDERGLCSELSCMLKRYGYNVMCANSNIEARQAISLNPVDIAILDLNLPDGNGLDLLSHIRKQNEDIFAIILTAYGTLDSAVQAIRGEVYDYLAKPVDIARLLQILKNAASFKILNKKMTEKMLFLEQLQRDALNKEFEIIKLKEEIKNLRNHPEVQSLYSYKG